MAERNRKPATRKQPAAKQPRAVKKPAMSEDDADALVSQRELATRQRYSLDHVLSEHGYTVER